MRRALRMESVVKLHSPPHLAPFRYRPSAFLKTRSSISSASSSRSSARCNPPSLRAAYDPSPSRPISKSLQNLTVSLTAAAAAAAAALLLSRFPQRTPFASISTTVQSEPQPQFSVPENLSDEEKEKALEAHLESNPEDAQSLRALMEIKVKLRKLPEAIGVADRLIPLEPDDNDLPLLRTHFQFYGGDVKGAKEGFESIISKDPFVVEAYHGLVMAASKNEGELDGVLTRVEEMIERCKKEKRNAELRDFKLLMAQVKVIKEEYQGALEIYQDLVKEEPRDFRPYLCQGIIYTLLRKKDEAVKQFDKYRRLVPKGHPYARYFEENMAAMGALVESKKKGKI